MTVSEVLKIGPHVICAPVVHGSGDSMLAVRRLLLEESFDCVAVPLPLSFRADVLSAIRQLPHPTMVIQRPTATWKESSAEADEYLYSEEEIEGESLGEPVDDEIVSYVPIDPCQPVIAALRFALSERLPVEFIDLETNEFIPHTAVLPDPYALKKVSLERFAAAVLPSIERPTHPQQIARIAHMAAELRELSIEYRKILFVVSVLDWPWIREAFLSSEPSTAVHEEVGPTERMQIEPRTLMFMLGELPYITSLYERARIELEDDENLSIDGVKQLLLDARVSYRNELGKRARKISPRDLRQVLHYIRNLTLFHSRLSPDLYAIVTAAKQICGDYFALHVAEKSREYPLLSEPIDLPIARLGVHAAELPSGDIVDLVSRLPGAPLEWRTCQLSRRPERKELDEWQMKWNPFSQCSWPPEDEVIENFRAHVMDRAQAAIGADLARTEKFTTSIMDGIDIRDTLRHWYDNQIYVKILPPARGRLDAVVMLFDTPADPRDYPWRSTWFAEHNEESTLAFFATDFRQEMVGPGIALATYGGAMFIYPPVAIEDIWNDEMLDFTETLEQRLIAAACMHSRSPHVVLVSPQAPGAGWRKLARHFGKKLVHLSLQQFSDATVSQLRQMHVLNGKQVRSYAADFIRKA
ncbi:hypothetical protein Psta_1756 [Pirellula staleyi DSM 6068]|uniref:Uncharacterized protein n=1 Tax=Pirellula staleyi (strain ATCC 27377 / DSM 6068 / ICPB 4128) TaxID=530564 RepID=D2QYX6_PIRSD|nr:hypothetical protein [Pirellula staleyi]ADB16431.1 hypothetical protein Psta_1756 [Pirellula staleyi DSM 6068]